MTHVSARRSFKSIHPRVQKRRLKLIDGIGYIRVQRSSKRGEPLEERIILVPLKVAATVEKTSRGCGANGRRTSSFSSPMARLIEQFVTGRGIERFVRPVFSVNHRESRQFSVCVCMCVAEGYFQRSIGRAIFRRSRCTLKGGHYTELRRDWKRVTNRASIDRRRAVVRT